MKLTYIQLAIFSAAIFVFTSPHAAQAADAAVHNGADTFQANCSVCHGDNGAGSDVGKSLHVPDLRSHLVQSQSNTALERFIGEGKGAMPPFKDRLDHQQTLDVILYVRSLAKHSGAHQ